MSFLRKMFGKKVNESEQPRTFTEKDNRGTRHETMDFAVAYWTTRMTSPRKDPFVLYHFDVEKDAREALLELPCIQVATDSGKLICTEMLIFGYYQTGVPENWAITGKYEAIICGDELTHDLWEQAKASFIKHGGRPKGQGELEPEKRAIPSPKSKVPQPSKVVFVREDRQNKMGATFVYRIYKAPDAASAKAFLEQNPVTKQLFYIVVETPEGNYSRDIQGIYKE